MVTYADYDYYISKFKGDMPKEEFQKLSIQATNKIKLESFNRINVDNIPDEVKYCTCLITEKMKMLNAKEGKSSESVGTWSISYDSYIKKDNIIHQIIVECLQGIMDENGTPLLYRGC